MSNPTGAAQLRMGRSPHILRRGRRHRLLRAHLGLAVTPNGQDLFATNDPDDLDSAGILIGNGASRAYGLQLSGPTSAATAGPFSSSGALGAQVELPDAVETDGVNHAYTTGALTVSPDGRDVYVASETFTGCGCANDAEFWLTGFPVASVSLSAKASPRQTSRA